MDKLPSSPDPSHAPSATLRLRHLFGHFSKSMLWQVSSLLFAFYLTEQCGLRPFSMALVMGLSLLCNGLIDGLIGIWLRSWMCNAADGRRFQMIGAGLAGLSFVLFSATAMVEAPIRFGWALGWLLLFRCTYPLLDVAQNAFGTRLATDTRGRRAIIAQRHMMSAMAGITLALVIAPVLLRGGPQAPPRFLICAAIMAVMACFGAWLQDPRRLPTEPPCAPDLTRRSSLTYAQGLLLIGAMGAITSVFHKMAPYYLAFGLAGRSGEWLAWMALGNGLSQYGWPRLRERTQDTVLILASAALLMLGSALLWADFRDNLPLFYGAGLLIGIGSGGLAFLSWSAMASSASLAQPYLKAGLFTACSKLAQALAMLAIGALLQGGAYRHSMVDPRALPTTAFSLAPMLMGLCALLIVTPRRQWNNSRSRMSAAAPSGADNSGASSATQS